MMLQPLPPSRVLHEWGEISRGLKQAIKRDPKANWLDMLGMAISGQMQFWRCSGPSDGFLATEVQRFAGTLKRALVIVYAGGLGNGPDDMRAMMEIIELVALKSKCVEVRFEGRKGWRRVFHDYQATCGEDGRWRFRKALT